MQWMKAWKSSWEKDWVSSSKEPAWEKDQVQLATLPSFFFLQLPPCVNYDSHTVWLGPLQQPSSTRTTCELLLFPARGIDSPPITSIIIILPRLANFNAWAKTTFSLLISSSSSRQLLNELKNSSELPDLCVWVRRATTTINRVPKLQLFCAPLPVLFSNGPITGR